MKGLTAISTPFGLLQEVYKSALVTAWETGEDVQIFNGDTWSDEKFPSWAKHIAYRLKPKTERRVLHRDFGIKGRHVIECDPTGENPTVKWEAS